MRKYLQCERQSALLQLCRRRDALARGVLARHLDHLVVHGTLGALVHALVDLVDEREGAAAELCEAHEVQDRRQRAFLWAKSAGCSARPSQRPTHAARLSLAGEQLQSLRVAELDEDVDAPEVEVCVLRNADLA